MTMAPYDDDDAPTLRELSRILRDFRDEFRVQMSMMVRKDVHAVEHTAMAEKCKVMEDRLLKLEASRDGDEKSKASTRNQMLLSVVAAALSLVVALIVAAVK
jgi:hypothetical protein